MPSGRPLSSELPVLRLGQPAPGFAVTASHQATLAAACASRPSPMVLADLVIQADEAFAGPPASVEELVAAAMAAFRMARWDVVWPRQNGKARMADRVYEIARYGVRVPPSVEFARWSVA